MPGAAALAALVLIAGTALAFHLRSTGEAARLLGRRRPSAGKLPAAIIRPPHDVNALAFYGGLLWAGGMEGVQGLDPASGATVRPSPCGLRFELVRALRADSGGALWIGHAGGLTRFDGSRCTTYTEASGLPDKRVQAVYEDRERRLWAGTWGGAAYWDGNSWHGLTRSDGLLVDMVNVILQDRRGALWFGSYAVPGGGISILSRGKWQHFTTANGLPHSHVTSLLESSDGSVWAGVGFYDRGGLARFTCDENGCTLAQVLSKRDGLAGEKVRSLYQDRSGAIWAGSEYDGIARRGQDGWKVYTTENGLSDNEVLAMAEDGNGDLWMATKDGITKLQAAALQSAL
jgi:ligand-binding sensor domain-containing protein